MINQRIIRQWFRSILLTSVDPAICAWENRDFDPSALDLWVGEQMFEIDEFGVTSRDDEKDGFQEFQVNVPIALGTEAAEGVVQTVEELFDPRKRQMVSIPGGQWQNYELYILETEVLDPRRIRDRWYRVGVRMKYRVFEAMWSSSSSSSSASSSSSSSSRSSSDSSSSSSSSDPWTLVDPSEYALLPFAVNQVQIFNPAFWPAPGIFGIPIRIKQVGQAEQEGLYVVQAFAAPPYRIGVDIAMLLGVNIEWIYLQGL